MTRAIQAPTVTPTPDHAVAESVETHPSYGQIEAFRVTSTGTYLYGSDFTHHGFMMLRISRSENHRGLSHDYHHARDQVIEVALSEAQWATFVSTPNAGQGVPCTIQYEQGTGHTPGLPEPVQRRAQFGGEMNQTLKDALGKLAALRERIEAGKAGKESLKMLDLAVQEIEANMPFVSESFDRHMEQTTEKAKIEVETYIQGAVARRGLQALQGDLARTPPVALPEATDAEVLHEFGMFTTVGDEMVHDVVQEVLGLIRAGAALPAQRETLKNGLLRVAVAGHGEVFDTAVREAVAAAIADETLDVDAVFRAANR